MPAASLQSLLEAVELVPALMERIAALERKVASLEPKKVKKWLTQKEAADVLRCSEKKISRLVKAGRLRRNLESFRVVILASDVDDYAGRVTLPKRA